MNESALTVNVAVSVGFWQRSVDLQKIQCVGLYR